jgi:hypothetical protein
VAFGDQAANEVGADEPTATQHGDHFDSSHHKFNRDM